MYNYWQIGAENGGKVPLASNQVVGSSSLSGRARFFKDFRRLTKSRVSEINRIVRVYYDSQGGNR